METSSDRSSSREVAIREIMSSHLVAIRSDCDLMVALDTFMRTGLRHLVVVDEDRSFRGIITPEQVLAVLGTTGRRYVADHVTATGLRIHVEEPVQRAAQLMVAELVDALPVVDDGGRVIGIVSWSDIVALVARRDLVSD